MKQTTSQSLQRVPASRRTAVDGNGWGRLTPLIKAQMGIALSGHYPFLCPIRPRRIEVDVALTRYKYLGPADHTSAGKPGIAPSR